MACLDRWFIDDVASNEEAQGLEIFSRTRADALTDSNERRDGPTLQ
jgi:hypothetical protein